MARAFAALIDALCAAQAGDALALRDAVTGVPPQRLFARAVAHRCAGLLLAALADQRLYNGAARELWKGLQAYAARCAVENEKLRIQIQSAVDALASAGVPHALLKGAARLQSGERTAPWSEMADIDMLVPRECVDAAVRALQAQGYRFACDSEAQEGYRIAHHHLAPLVPPDVNAKPIELHTAFGCAPQFEMRTDWESLATHIVPVQGAASTTYRLDAFARALHAAVHGSGLYRLFDAAVAASEFRRERAVLSALEAWASREQEQRIPMLAVVAMGARIAQLPVNVEPRVQRYLEWAVWREDAPRRFRGRLQLLDAWFARAMTLAIPRAYACDGGAISMPHRLRTLGARAAVGLAAAGYRHLRLP
jgi:hypothetical protein